MGVKIAVRGALRGSDRYWGASLALLSEAPALEGEEKAGDSGDTGSSLESVIMFGKVSLSLGCCF